MNELTIKIRDIGEDLVSPLSLPLSRSFIEDALIGLGAEPDRSSGKVQATIYRTGDNVFVQGQLEGTVVLPCARCIKPAELPLVVPLRIVVGPKDLGAEDSLDDEIEYVTHDGETVFLGEILREALILALPIAPLCRPDCKGLCPVCGNDLNERVCGCEVRVVDPRLAVLKDLKI